MLFVAHRINTVQELKSIPRKFGVEIDVRSFSKQLILSHEPFESGEALEKWIKYYCHKFLIINVKEEGIELAIRRILRKFHIRQYFFLDVSFPCLFKLANSGLRNLAVRVSEFESINTALSLAGKLDWAWVDCFNKELLKKKEYNLLSQYFKICIASPELQGFPTCEINKFKFSLRNYHIDAVCTKKIGLWL
jgi:hypothetical protein